MPKVFRWNTDKPHRCPQCHTVVVNGTLSHLRRPRFLSTYSASSWAVYECCRCKTRFTRWPWLAVLLPVRGCNAEECPFRLAGEVGG